MPADRYNAQVSDASDARLAAIAAALGDYNTIADDAGQIPERLKRLRTLDTAIYAWFAANPAPDLDALADGPLLKGLLKESYTEHAEIVDGIRQRAASGAADLPIDVTGMTPSEVRAVRRLWRSLANRRGQLRIDDADPAFAKRMWGELAKLLQTQTGRDVVGHLDARRGFSADKRIEIVPELPADLQQASETESSYAVATASLTDANFRGHELSADRSVASGTYPAVAGPDDITRAVLAGACGIEVNGVSYTFGAGSAAYVKVVSADGAPSPHKMAGPQQNEVIDPEFVGTLGHELGHAMKIRAGALAPNDDSAVLAAFEADEGERKLWSDRAEEFININAIENRIRSEHGIPLRKYHKPLASVTAALRTRQLFALYQAARADDPSWSDIPEYVEAAMLTRADTKLSDDILFNARLARLQALIPFIDARGVTLWKTAKVDAAIRAARAAVGDDALLKHLPSWHKLQSHLRLNGPYMVAPGSDLRRTMTCFADFQKAFPAELPAARKAQKRARRKKPATV